MQIKIHTDTLKQTRWYECAIRFILGGAITVIAGLIAKKFGPAAGGLFLAFPAIFPASATLVEKHEAEKKEKEGMHGEQRGRDAAALDAAGAALGSIGLATFAVLAWQLLPNHHAWIILFAAMIVWFLSSCCFWFVREHRQRIFRMPRHAPTQRSSRML